LRQSWRETRRRRSNTPRGDWYSAEAIVHCSTRSASGSTSGPAHRRTRQPPAGRRTGPPAAQTMARRAGTHAPRAPPAARRERWPRPVSAPPPKREVLVGEVAENTGAATACDLGRAVRAKQIVENQPPRHPRSQLRCPAHQLEAAGRSRRPRAGTDDPRCDLCSSVQARPRSLARAGPAAYDARSDCARTSRAGRSAHRSANRARPAFVGVLFDIAIDLAHPAECCRRSTAGASSRQAGRVMYVTPTLFQQERSTPELAEAAATGAA